MGAPVAPIPLTGTMDFIDGGTPVALTGTLDGNALSLTGGGDTFTGTLSDNVMNGTYTTDVEVLPDSLPTSWLRPAA